MNACLAAGKRTPIEPTPINTGKLLTDDNKCLNIIRGSFQVLMAWSHTLIGLPVDNTDNIREIGTILLMMLSEMLSSDGP